MTTNDEQAKYGEATETGGGWINLSLGKQPCGVLGNAHPKEREPMLPILTTYDEHKSKYGMLGRELYFIDGWGKGADAYRTAMDELITTGKLRVVEEVELVDGICSACGYDAGMPRDVNGQDMTPPCCPGCGNKIKR